MTGTLTSVRRDQQRGWVLAALTVAVGLIIVVANGANIVLEIGRAYGERGGYDAHLAGLLFMGWTSLACGLLMLGAVPAMARGSTKALLVAAGGAGVFGVGCALLAPAQPEFAGGVPFFGGYVLLTLAAAALRLRS